MSQRKRILVAPLNWGLGHATRCIPIIRELDSQGVEVFLACDGRPLELLKKEFPGLPVLILPDYGIRYYTSNMVWNLAWKIPHVLNTIRQEQRVVRKLVKEYRLDGIISDNRFGCYHDEVRSAFITHQIFIKVPGFFLEKTIRLLNDHFISRFNTCWVPDVAGEPNLSGELSHGHTRHNLRYIGPLSRMEFFETEWRYDVIAVLSGPEPQRTRLEKKLISQAKEIPGRFLIVQGKTEREERSFISKNIEVVSWLPSQALNKAILSSKVVIARSGYSTIMDLAKLGKTAIFVPTPGQTEQEYLAQQFSTRRIFFSQAQHQFHLKTALDQVSQYTGLHSNFFQPGILKKTIEDFLQD
jgi:UDP:flavonoid glycosyltransferase YjiC (YdhE family)